MSVCTSAPVHTTQDRRCVCDPLAKWGQNASPAKFPITLGAHRAAMIHSFKTSAHVDSDGAIDFPEFCTLLDKEHALSKVSGWRRIWS